MGSRGGEYGAEGVEYLYEQFDLMSTVSKKHQITLLQVSGIACMITCNMLIILAYMSCLCVHVHAHCLALSSNIVCVHVHVQF